MALAIAAEQPTTFLKRTKEWWKENRNCVAPTVVSIGSVATLFGALFLNTYWPIRLTLLALAVVIALTAWIVSGCKSAKGDSTSPQDDPPWWKKSWKKKGVPFVLCAVAAVVVIWIANDHHFRHLGNDIYITGAGVAIAAVASLILCGFNRPLVWGVIYVLAIPLFGFAYKHFDCDFFQTGATHESAYRTNSTKVISAVKDGISNIIELKKTSQPPGSAQLSSVVQIDDLTSSGSAAIVKGRIGTAIGAAEAPQYHNFQISITSRPLSDRNASPSDFVDVPFNLVSGDTRHRGDDTAFNTFVKYSKSSNPPPVLRMLDENAQAIGEVVTAQQGTVDNLPDQSWRMLYFSAVTETTLGFGDIAPVSTKMRNAVAAQAVLGVVVIGLFLNAVGKRTEKTRQQSSSPGPGSANGQGGPNHAAPKTKRAV